MEEFVGLCKGCGKKIFCRNGFLDGVTEGKELFCFNCANDKREKESV